MKWIFVDVSSCSCSLCEGVRGQSWLKVPAEVLFLGGGDHWWQRARLSSVSERSVLAKLVGDSASFLQFSGDSEKSLSRSICCSHHQRCGTAPLFHPPYLHLFKIRRVASYTAIICQRTVMYSSSVLTKYSRPWHTIVCHDRPEGLPPKIVVQSQLP